MKILNDYWDFKPGSRDMYLQKDNKKNFARFPLDSISLHNVTFRTLAMYFYLHKTACSISHMTHRIFLLLCLSRLNFNTINLIHYDCTVCMNERIDRLPTFHEYVLVFLFPSLAGYIFVLT